MSFEVEATYEDGVLKFDRPLPLREQERVLISIKSKTDRVADSYGMVPKPDDLDALEYLAHSPDNSGLDSN